MRLRCVCDDDSGCWHLRSARGRPLVGRRQIVWVHGRGTMTPMRAMWLFATGEEAPQDKVVARKCDSRDCVNPEHLQVIKRQALVRRQHKQGIFNTPQHREAARRTAIARRVITEELRRWIVESSQSGVAVAHALGVTQSRVNAIRQHMRQRLLQAAPSVFAFGAAMVVNDGRARAAA
jgi:predicted XRE-type DNA-binding protein